MPEQADREELRRRLLGLGFDEVHFASVGRIPEAGFRRWLERGWQAEMDWMARTADKRLDPGLVVAGAGSVVLFGVNTLPAEAGAARQERWARYSLYEDYHDTVLRAVRRAGDLLARHLGLGPDDWRAYVDTGPVMERGWAASAGLGWLGKNGMLVSRTHGNWLLLGAVILRASIEADPSLAGGRDLPGGPPSLGRFCGTCDRCRQACPTGAIPEPGLVDARRCLSYLSIEEKGGIPLEFRAAMGGRIFGCDICLEVCPWNRFARAGRQILLAARYDLAELTLLDILTLTPDRFASLFRRTVFKRLKRERLIRNACVVAGNLDEAEAWRGRVGGSRTELVRVLVRLSGGDNALVRAHAVWAVRRLAGGAAGRMLAEARARETDPSVIGEYA